MKKRTVLLLIALSLLAGVFTGCARIREWKNKINEMVSGLESIADLISAMVPPEEAVGEGKTLYETDDQGQIVKLYRYNGKGDLVFVHENVWENGRLIHKTSYDSAGNVTGSYDYEYDERGNNTVSSWFFWDNGILMKAEAVFDEKNRKIESTGYGRKNISTNKAYMEYYEESKTGRNLLSKKTYYPAWPGDRYYVSSYEYTEDEQLLKETRVDQNGDLSDYTVYEYDENGKNTAYTSFDAEGKIRYSYKLFYDEEGKKIREERYDENGKLVSVTR